MKSTQNIKRFRFCVATLIGYYVLLFAPTLTLAFRPSPSACKRNYNTIRQQPRRGMYNNHERKNCNNNDGNARHPVHVLLDYYRPQDSLFSGIAEIGMGCALGVLYSEYFIIVTGCGAPNFSDTLERICYQGVIVVSSLALFNRIVTQFKLSLKDTVNNQFGPLQSSTLLQVDIVEFLTVIAVIGAFVALDVQYTKGVDMDGLSGIDIGMCRAFRGDVR